MYVKLCRLLIIVLFVICDVSSQNRLPLNTYPINYNVWLNFTDPAKQLFSGIVTIEIGIKMETNQIHLNDMTTNIDAVQLSEKDNEVEIPVVFSRGTGTTIIELTERKLLEMEKLYKIKITYFGDYGLLAGQNVSITWNSFDFVVANHVFPFNIQYVLPCYDEPQFKATFEITIRHDLNTTAVSNMAAEIVKYYDGYLVTNFTKTPPLPTYSVAFAISNYGRVQRNGFKTINAFYGKSYQPSDVAFVLDINQLVVEKLVKYINVQLDIEVINLVPVYELPIENFGTLGLLINHQSNYYYNCTSATTLDKDNIVRYVSQFYANQFFGSLISPEWWPQIWFNQGVSKLLEYTISSQIYPELEQMDLYLYNIYTHVNTSTTSALEPNIESRLDILNHLNNVTWKATAFIYMILNLLTERVFKLGLAQIIKDPAYLPTNTKQIFDSLTRVAHENDVLSEHLDLYRIFEEWIISSDLPTLTVIRDYNTGNVTLMQSAVNLSSSIWVIPFNYLTQTHTTKKWNITTPDGWLQNVSSVELKMCAELKSTDWIIFNREFSAFYKTNYDTTNWLLLAKQLRRDHEKIPRNTRGQLMHDAYTFWTSGTMSYNIMFYFFSYLHQETSPVPFQPFLLYVRDNDRIFYGTEMYANFTKFVVHQLSSVYQRIRITNPSAKLNLSIFDQMNQAKVLTYLCRMNYQPCLIDAQSVMHFYLDSNELESGVEILSYGFVLCDEIRFWEVFDRVNNPLNRDKNLVEMLGFTQKSANIKHLLNILLTKNGDEYHGVPVNLEVDDRITIFEVLQLNNLQAINLVYDVVENNSEIIKEIYGEEFHWIISNLILYAPTVQKYEQIMRTVPLYRTDMHNFEYHTDMAKSTLISITRLIEQTQDVLAYLLENEIDTEEQEEEWEKVTCVNEKENAENDNTGDQDGDGSRLTASGSILILLNIGAVIMFNFKICQNIGL